MKTPWLASAFLVTSLGLFAAPAAPDVTPALLSRAGDVSRLTLLAKVPKAPSQTERLQIMRNEARRLSEQLERLPANDPRRESLLRRLASTTGIVNVLSAGLEPGASPFFR